MNKIKKIFSKIASWACTLLLIFSMIAALGALFLRNPAKINFIGKYAVVRILTQSMEPTIRTGDYILVEKVDANALQTGEIIIFYSRDPSILGQLNTHRILSFSENGNIVTKGDNNPRQDDYEVAREDVAGRYVTNLDFLTGVFKIFSKPVGYVALIGLPLMLITLLSLKEVVAACKKDDGAEGAKEEAEKARVAAVLEKMKESGELDRRLEGMQTRAQEDETGKKEKEDSPIEEREKKCPLIDGAHGEGESPDLENSLKKESEEERKKPL